MADFMQNRYEAFYNARVKIYPGEEFPDELIISQDYIFNPDKWEVAESYDSFALASFSPSDERSKDEGEKEKNLDGNRQSWCRARRRGYDYIRSNADLDCFVTLTFSADEVDRTDWGKIVDKLSDWLDNRVRRHGLKYVLVPEFHKDGESYHFHGLMNRKALKLVDSGRKRHNKKVYNIVDFPFGFTTALGCSGAERTKACAGYIYKYMGKSGAGCHQAGSRYMLAGGDLKKPIYKYFRINFEEAALPPLAVPFGAVKVTRNSEKISEVLSNWQE